MKTGTCVGWAAVAAAVMMTACSAPDARDHQESLTEEGPGLSALPPGESEPKGTSLDGQFAAASAEFDVPAALLKSIGWVETRWNMVVGEEEFWGAGRRYGIMGLHENVLEEAAALAGVSVEDARTDPTSNIAAAAALLSAHADEDEEDIERTDVGAWAPHAARYGAVETEVARSAYVHEEVFATIAAGVFTEGATLAPTEVTPRYPYMDQTTPQGADYAPAKWRPSPNHSARPSGSAGDPQMVVIHSCEGSYSGCWGWLTNASSGVSAHYVVNTTGTDVSQLVRENRKAWHVGAKYQCSRNDDVSCGLNNVSSNSFTVGIEHAGYASQGSWNAGLLDASAALTCDITDDHGIPRDEWHIVGHGQLQPYNRVDPGPNWPWADYINRVNSACGGGAPPDPPADPPENEPPPSPGALTIVIDSNSGANGTDASYSASSSWTASTNVGGYYNTGYFWRSTGASSDAALFKAYLPSAKTMVVEAWWSAASDRSQTTPFVIFDGSGQQLDVVHKNQRQNGGQWVTLGTYNFTAGWNVVALSRWTSPGDVVVADAVRFREVN